MSTQEFFGGVLFSLIFQKQFPAKIFAANTVTLEEKIITLVQH
jgi:hypothetical protein